MNQQRGPCRDAGIRELPQEDGVVDGMLGGVLAENPDRDAEQAVQAVVALL